VIGRRIVAKPCDGERVVVCAVSERSLDEAEVLHEHLLRRAVKEASASHR
jgi:hypothetical protein